MSLRLRRRSAIPLLAALAAAVAGCAPAGGLGPTPAATAPLETPTIAPATAVAKTSTPASTTPATTPTLAETPTAMAAAATTPAEPPRFGPPRDLLDLPPGSTLRGVSPDARWVAYQAWPEPRDGQPSGDPSLVARDLASGDTLTLLEDAARLSDLRFLPDGRRVLIATGAFGDEPGRILLREMGPSPARTLVTLGGIGLIDTTLVLSPDGERVAFTVGHYDEPAPVSKVGIEVVRLDGAGRREVVSPDYFVGHPTWTPDGKRIVYFRGKGGTPPEDGDAHVVEVDSPGALPLLLHARLRLVGLSPDGARSLWASAPSGPAGVGLLVGDRQLASPPRLLTSALGGSGAAWVAADWIAYAHDGALLLVSAAGGEPRRLTSEDERIESPIWLPRAGIAYLAGGSPPTLRLLPLADGR